MFYTKRKNLMTQFLIFTYSNLPKVYVPTPQLGPFVVATELVQKTTTIVGVVVVRSAYDEPSLVLDRPGRRFEVLDGVDKSIFDFLREPIRRRRRVRSGQKDVYRNPVLLGRFGVREVPCPNVSFEVSGKMEQKNSTFAEEVENPTPKV